MSTSNGDIAETGCCPHFHPETLNDKELHFENKLFLEDQVNSLFHIPLNYGKVMERNFALIEKSGAATKNQLVLSDEGSMWRSKVYIEVSKNVPSGKMIRLSGTFLVKVFEGSYGKMGTFIHDMKLYVKSKGKEIKKIYFYYPYCPKCAKAYGKNFIVILAKV